MKKEEVYGFMEFKLKLLEQDIFEVFIISYQFVIEECKVIELREFFIERYIEIIEII